jgi:hypothetical protein
MMAGFNKFAVSMMLASGQLAPRGDDEEMCPCCGRCSNPSLLRTLPRTGDTVREVRVCTRCLSMFVLVFEFFDEDFGHYPLIGVECHDAKAAR